MGEECSDGEIVASVRFVGELYDGSDDVGNVSEVGENAIVSWLRWYD